ncbi:hypothetical protein COV18_05005 [Candidatus Woesearchaeota archaeon CG10_big_fil_rev_8_21_14_0_10_37_12]|nr:MAG: hypothetical protein COV18_05005 [Candidatus Woesearchaeota archaeon CG10_big_fil_rev_8_21_14_0_10_37_12]
MKKPLLLFVLLSLISCGQALTGATTAEDTITIGFVGPLSGDSAIYGILEKNVIEIALNEINSAGGINSKQVNVIYEDGKCTAKGAVSAATKLIEVDKVKIILSVCGAETFGISPLAEQNKVLVIAAWATLPDITHSGDYIFRTIYSDEVMGNSLAKELSKYKTVGLITEQTNYPVGISTVIRKYFEKEGRTVIEEFYEQDSQDHRTQLTKLLAQKPDVIYLNPNTPATGIASLNQLQELGYKGQLYGNFFGTNKEVRKHPLADGMIFFSEPPVSESPKKKKLFEKYKEKYGEDPAFEYGAAARYDSVYILKNAIEAVGYDATAIKNWLYEMEPYDGILGKISFDENGDVIGTKPAKNQIKNGEIMRLS